MRPYPARTHYAGRLRPAEISSHVSFNGWVASRRDLGGLIFIDLRDHTGIVQLVFSPQHAPELMDKAGDLRSEYVIAVTGEVRRREKPNHFIPTGEVEVYCTELVILNRSETPPFEIGKRDQVGEELRLKYRYLDLRDAEMQRIIRLRSQVYGITHQYFAENGFVEIETPMLVRSTPEGARDYLVPSRVHPGKFYALPQSPQIYKQLLMVAGYDRYMQIAKCMRDEDLRADRQPEFTQLDLEMAFVEQEDVLQLVEGYLVRIWKEIKGIDLQLPLLRMPYHEAMSRYGTDKPDIRFSVELHDVADIFGSTGFSVFKGTLESGGAIAGIKVSGGATYSRKVIDELTEVAKRYGAKGLVWLKLTADDMEGGSAKFFSNEEKDGMRERFSANEGDLLLIVADEWRTCHTALGSLRLDIARREKLIPENMDAPLFVIDFPMFEMDKETGTITPAHHPFTSYKREDEGFLETDPLRVRANAYDLVINGYELASGSIRIHDRETQAKIFSYIGLSDEEAQKKFGFLLEAFRYGAPPHGGIAPGIDRLIMVLAGTDNIRDVIAFPKTASAASLMDEAPSPLANEQLKPLHIQLREK
ncbi:MAG: aspartate--tRNA ligase [Candidatus Kapaibacterium sp.]